MMTDEVKNESWLGRLTANQGKAWLAGTGLLAAGLVAGFIGGGTGATAVGVLVLAGFVYLWISMLIEAEREWT